MRTAVIAVVLGVLLAGGGVGAWLYQQGKGPFSSDPKHVAEAAEHGVETTSPLTNDPIYFPLDPPFLVNFEVEGTLRFLQVSVDVMARDKAVIDQVQRHMPYIRNNLLILLSNHTYQTVGTREAREELREAALLEVRRVLQEVTGNPGVEALYFTGFVMQ